jgi:hypothetical protein
VRRDDLRESVWFLADVEVSSARTEVCVCVEKLVSINQLKLQKDYINQLKLQGAGEVLCHQVVSRLQFHPCTPRRHMPNAAWRYYSNYS